MYLWSKSVGTNSGGGYRGIVRGIQLGAVGSVVSCRDRAPDENKCNLISADCLCWLSLSVVVPPGERLRDKGRYGVFVMLKLCDPYLSASGVSFSQWGAIKIYLLLPFWVQLTANSSPVSWKVGARYLSPNNGDTGIPRTPLNYAYGSDYY